MKLAYAVCSGRLLCRSVLPTLRPKRRLLSSCYPVTSISSSEGGVQVDGREPKPKKRGTVVGIYEGEEYELSAAGIAIDTESNGKLSHLLDVAGRKVKKGEEKLFYDVSRSHSHVVVVGLGEKDSTDDHLEDIDTWRQNVRCAAAVGCKALQKADIDEVVLDDFGDPEACAEGSVLGLFSFDSLKDSKKRKKTPDLQLFGHSSLSQEEAWSKGVVTASAQNFARQLMETPSNMMTPTMFVESVTKRLGEVQQTTSGKLEVIPRPLSWIEAQKMGAFMCVAKGSAELPWLLELRYNYSSNNQPIALVGKGVTFDSGGISIKPAAGMGLMKGDMGGAATVAGTFLAVASLGLPVSLVGLMPLCENMPSGTAVKPGDVVYAMNGKSIEVDNTDAEGRLILADALSYAHSFNPKAIVDLATLTGAIDVALGNGAAGVFTNSQSLWEQLHQAGHVTGDRLWRMPLYQQYLKQIESRVADVHNIGTRRGAGACTAAMFLKEFITVPCWAHIDIAGVMESHGEVPFLNKGMTGRPTRTLINFLEHAAL